MRMSKDDSKTPAASPEGERIARRLARAGVASRREAERMIEDGRVRVNGKVIGSPALNVTLRDDVEVDGIPLAPPDRPRLWRYNKPAGLVTTEWDEEGRDTVFDNLPGDLPRVMSVGRLDLTSEGLLLLTNDGALKRRLELPSTGWLRKYRVRVHGRPTEAELSPLSEGMVVDGERFQPMTFSFDRQQGANAWLTVALREGRNREVRRALGALGFEVGRLIRVSYGPFQLNDLAPGAVEEIRAKVLRDQLQLDVWEDEEGPSVARGARAAAGDAGASLRRGPGGGGGGVAGGGGKPGGQGARPGGKTMAKTIGGAGAGPGGKSAPRVPGENPMRRMGKAAPGTAGRGESVSGKQTWGGRGAGGAGRPAGSDGVGRPGGTPARSSGGLPQRSSGGASSGPGWAGDRSGGGGKGPGAGRGPGRSGPAGGGGRGPGGSSGSAPSGAPRGGPKGPRRG
jgi:23S rRNA pseudouridine2605 synthase